MPCSYRIYNERRAGHDVAAGEEARHIGGHCLLVYHRETAAYLLHLVVQAGDVGALADGEDDHISGEHVLCFGERVEVRAAIHEATEVHFHAAHAGHAALLAGDLLERSRGEEFDPFLLGVSYLPFVGGHRFAGFQAGHAYPGSAQSHSGHGRVYGYVAAA